MLGEQKQLHLGIAEDAPLRQHILQHDELSLNLSLFKLLRLRNKLSKLKDFLPKCHRVNRGNHVFELCDDFVALLLRQILKVFWQLPSDLLFAVSFGISKNPLAFILHSFQSSPDSINARRKAALQQSHRESESAATG